MLDDVKQFLEKLVAEYPTITIEGEIMIVNKRLEYTLSTVTHMASISVLPDLSYDFFAIDILSEETFLMNLKKFNNIEELFIVLTNDITSFMKL